MSLQICLRQSRFTVVTRAAAMICCSWMVAAPALAVERVYTILTSQSSIAISGNLATPLGTAQLQQQGPGSLTTTYSGAIRADRGAGSIQFLPGSAIDANVSGNWRPLADANGGSAPADYGGTASLIGFTADLTARDVAADLNSDALSLGNDGSFSLSTVLLSYTNGSIAASTTLAAGVAAMVGPSSSWSGMGSLVGAPGTETLMIPINSMFSSTFSMLMATGPTLNLTLSLTFSGQLVATAATPEPATDVLLMFAAAGAFIRQNRAPWRVPKLVHARATSTNHRFSGCGPG